MTRLLIAVCTSLLLFSNAFASHYFTVPEFTNENYKFVDPGSVKSFETPDGYTIIYKVDYYTIKDKAGNEFTEVPATKAISNTEECIHTVLCNRDSVNASATNYMELTVNSNKYYTAYYSSLGKLVSIVEGWPTSSSNLKTDYEAQLASCQKLTSRSAYQTCLVENCLSQSLSYSSWLSCQETRSLDEDNSALASSSISSGEVNNLNNLLDQSPATKSSSEYFENLNNAMIAVESKCKDDDNSICQNVLTSSLEGEMGVDSSGQLTYVLPLNLPEGLNGVEPKIGLTYGYGQDGYLGFGFSLSGVSSVIGRCASKTQLNARKAIKNIAADEYCVDGQRMVRISGAQGASRSVYTTEIDSYSRIVAIEGDSTGPKEWLLYDKEGYISTYAKTDANAAGVVQSWYLSKKEDRFGNVLEYSYQTEYETNLKVLYPSEISYGGNVVSFVYKDKIEPEKEGFKGGVLFKQNKLLAAIEIKAGNQSNTHRYLLNYTASNSRFFSTQLDNIRYCDADYKCTPATKFKWQERVYVEKPAIEIPNLPGKYAGTPMFFDFNKDGEQDVCIQTSGQFSCAIGPEFKSWERKRFRRDSGHIRHLQDLSFGNSRNLQVLDIRNDGYPEVCAVIGTERDIYCLLNNGGKLESIFKKVSPKGSSQQTESITRFLDINEDDFVDLCRIYRQYGYKKVSPKFRCFLNDGKGYFSEDVVYSHSTSDFSAELHFSEDKTRPDMKFLDVSGDGQPEFCGVKNSGGYACIRNESSSLSIKLPKVEMIPSLNDLASQFRAGIRPKQSLQYVEINGDGLLDICFAYDVNSSSFLKCYQNKGNFSFELSRDHSLELHAPLTDREAEKLRLVDITSDGLADLCEYDETEKQYACRVNLGVNGFRAEVSQAEYFLTDIGKDDSVSFIDTNQDGITEACVSKSTESKLICKDPSYKLEQYIAQPKRLNQVISGFGTVSEVVYETKESRPDLVTRSKPAKDFFISFPKTQPLVSSIVTQNAAATLSRVNYQYENFKQHPLEGSKGFEKITSTYEFQGLDQHELEIVTATYYQGKYDAGKLKESSKSIGNPDNIVETNSNSYEVRTRNGQNGSKYINLLVTETARKAYDLDGKELDYSRSKFENYDLNSGQAQTLTQEKRKGSDSTYTVVTKNVYRSVASPSASKTGWLVGRPTSTVVSHGYGTSPSISKKVTFTYNGNGSVASQTLVAGSSKQVITRYVYDSKGQRRSVTVKAAKDASGNLQNRTSSAINSYGGKRDNQYLSKITSIDPEGYKSIVELDSICKLPKSETAINGTVTNYEYDSLCRKTKQINPDGTYTEWKYEWANGAPIQPNWSDDIALSKNLPSLRDRDVAVIKVISQSFATGGEPLTPESITYFDALNREVRTETVGFDGRKIFTDKVFNAKGLLKRESLPYFENEGFDGLDVAQGDLVGIEANWMTTTYDALGRPIKVSSPTESGLKTVEYAYTGAQTTTKLNGRVTKTETVNSLDKIATVKDTIGNSTQFIYAANGDLLKTKNGSVDNVSYVLTNEYDEVGNKIKTIDPSMGTWTYAYNGFGELLEQKDAKGQVTKLTYDKLGRKKSRTDADGKVTNWSYYSSSASVGRRGALYKISYALNTSNHSDETFAYDVYGNINTHSKTVKHPLSGKLITSKTVSEYDQGRLTSLTTTANNESFVRNYHYNSNGYLQKITSPNISLQQVSIDTNTASKNFSLSQTDFAQIETAVANAIKLYQDALVLREKALLAEDKLLLEYSDKFLNAANQYYAELDQLLAKAEAAYKSQSESLLKQRAANEAHGLLSENGSESLLWAVTSKNAAGQIDAELAGNGIQTLSHFDPYSGHLMKVKTESTSTVLREARYQYDKFDNVTRQEVSIDDGRANYLNTYRYDSLDRLDLANLAGQSVDYSYDAFGNIKVKEGISNMVYDQSKNRLTQAIRSNGQKLLYYYDANGNQTKATLSGSLYRSVTWNVFNKPYRVVTYSKANGPVTSQFAYDANRNRSSQVLSGQSSNFVKTTTLYFGDLEIVYKNGVTEHHVNVMGNKRVVARITKKSSQQNKSVVFLHTDALKNVDLITDASGKDIQRFKYNPFGEQIKLATSAEIRARQDAHLQIILAQGLVVANNDLKEPYGFTGHEMMNDHQLIHMNARLYDMEAGRFLSADSVIPDPQLFGSYNRYIYVLNNPLKYHDPSGHCFASFIAGAIISFVASKSSDPILRLVGSVAGAYLMGPASLKAGEIVANDIFLHSFSAGFVNSGIQSGSLQGAVMGGFSSLITTGIGHGAGGGPLLGDDWLGTAILHGIAQGTMASLRGGDFKAGLSSGFVGSVMGHYTGGLSSLSEHESAQFAITVTMGGLTSRATGGSFNDGVISSATVFLFNDLMTIGLSVQLPTEMIKMIIPEFEGKGLEFGVVISFPGVVSSKFDFGLYSTGFVGGEEYGTGRYAIGVGYQVDRLEDFDGVGGEIGFNDGLGGLSISSDDRGNINGVGMHIGAGYSIGGSGTITKSVTIRKDIVPYIKNEFE
ncbi:RHS repeat-associated core domain-containing protein [Thiomicrorhabdus sp.]|uniref:RHS repeat-associated core domain-containing protein n=1 Tax=Thiomicrorhabdus sp. TaxID=2039724 RepID=UPI0029C8E073|nr:RHS repeat-associated core domain-containing protein [Thiomicrorhabdus sp.]